MRHARLLTLTVLTLAAAACKKSPPPAPPENDATKLAATPSTSAASSSTNTPAATGATPANAPSPADDASEPEVPAAFLKFEDLLLPLVREPEGDARSAKTCKVIEKLRIASLAVGRAMPPGVDSVAWEAAANEMWGAFHGLAATCTDTPPNDMPDLPIIDASYARLRELLPK